MSDNITLKEFTMGADPEFLCENPANGDVIRAGSVGCSTADDFGADGNGIIFEVRPKPAVNPLTVIHNIRELFLKKTFENPKFLDYKWVSGSESHNYVMGGHIHFGVKDINFEVASRTLSQYVGAVSLLIEDRGQGLKRRENGYGGFSEYRSQNHGFEYRTISSWLTSPYVASAILCLAKVVMSEMVNNKNFVPKNRVSAIDFKEMRTEKIRQNFDDIWKEITSMTLYPAYQPYIDVLYMMIANKCTWFPKTTMKESWGIIDEREYHNRKFSLSEIWS